MNNYNINNNAIRDLITVFLLEKVKQLIEQIELLGFESVAPENFLEIYPRNNKIKRLQRYIRTFIEISSFIFKVTHEDDGESL